MKQIMVQFGDIEPFLTENTDMGPSSRPRLLVNLATSPEKLKHVKLKLASVAYWGEVFVKATYNLEGDGPLFFTCYEEVQKVIAAVRAGHIIPRLLFKLFQHKHLQSRDCVLMLKAVCKVHLSILNIS